ncbi:MAG: hypothetical protein M5U09_04700 [Gammaproteobacteria bacterium]|nr:hypothetical protein [Gammaproteobacteria bacterium]
MRLCCEAVFLADVSGGNPFDEAVSRPWFELAAHFPGAPLPPAPLSATIELRGAADVDEALAERDAANLGCIPARGRHYRGQPRCRTRPALRGDAARRRRAPAGDDGGARLAPREGGRARGEGPGRGPHHRPAGELRRRRHRARRRPEGLVYARTHHRMATPGMVVTGIAGREPVPGREGGHLLTD